MNKLILSYSSAIALVLGSLAVLPAGAAPKRAKVIDFENGVVESLTKRPLDSLSQISEDGRKRKAPHLYRKRSGFSSETRETLSQSRYTP